MGRPPIGKTAMSAAERQRRHRAGLKPAPRYRDKRHVTKPQTFRDTEPVTKQPDPEIARLKARIAELSQVRDRYKEMDEGRTAERLHGEEQEARIRELEQENANLKARVTELKQRGEGQIMRRRRREEGQFGEKIDFSEVGKLRGENAALKSDIVKLKTMLQEEPDAAKLRKKIVDQQVEMASLRKAFKRAAKERDQYKSHVARVQPRKYAEARGLLTRQNYGVIVKALHSDRAKHVTAAELAEAERLFIVLKPLFDEHEASSRRDGQH
jgi:hypothetical protein